LAQEQSILLREETVMTDVNSDLQAYLHKEKKPSDILSTSSLSATALCVASGAILITIALSFGLMPRAFGADPLLWQVTVALVIAGILMFWRAVQRGLPVQLGALELIAGDKPEPERSTELYGIYLVGVGFVLLIQALACSMVFAAIAWSMAHLSKGEQIQLPPTAAQHPVAASGLANLFGRDAEESFFILGMLNLSTLVATLGAMFYFANSLYVKMNKPEREKFDRRLFWGGLWFRIGEAVLFNLVFFLVLRYYAPDRYLLLPLVSLMVGMFLKAGESLVSGVATRVFASIQSLVPNDLSSQKVIRLFAFELSGFEDNLSPEQKKKVVDSLVESIEAIPGVEQAAGDCNVTPNVRVEYNAAVVKPADIGRKVELNGLHIVTPDELRRQLAKLNPA
jgi:hypothetical protein